MKRFLVVALLLATSPALARPSVLNLTVDHGIPLTLNGPAASVFIANPEIADVQVMAANQVMIFGKRTGETSFMATDSKGNTLSERTVVVSQDLAELRQELDAAIPGNAIKATPIPNGIVLTGQAKDPIAVADAYKIAMRFLPAGGDIINRVQVSGSNQIQIRVRFAEVQRNIDNTLGFDWQNIFSAGSGFVLGLATGNIVQGTGTGAFNQNESTGLFPRPNNSSLNLPNNVLGASVNINHVSVNSMIEALSQNGLITILAEPNLTAMSGETANFLAGGEFPIPIPQGNGTISITFKSYGISLEFTPTLLAGDRISLHVRPEVSELTQTGSIVLNNITVPALTTRKAETTVEVGSGESFAIAGLMDNNQAQTVNEFPELGDLPVLGALFRSNHFQNGQTELVVIITPYVVKPSQNKLALPTDGYSPPSEADRILGLRNSASNPDARPVSGEPAGTFASPSAALAATSAESASTAVPIPVGSPVATVTTETPLPTAAPVTVEAPPTPHVISIPPATPALVLHPSSDKVDHSGGILVE